MASEEKSVEKTEPEAGNGTGAEPEMEAVVNEGGQHPLECSWDLWYLSADKQKEWDERLTRLMTFQTVEDFWALYHHVQLPSKLPVGSDYMLFKTGIPPKWEDKRNQEGGKWTIETTKNYRSHLDNSWLETLLAVIGEGFGEAGEDINGAVVQVRKKVDRLQIWTGNYANEDQTMAIGKTYKSVLKIEDRMYIQYQAHKDSITRIGSTCKARLRV